MWGWFWNQNCTAMGDMIWKRWSVTQKWKTWAALRWYVALIGEFDFETRKHLLQSQNRYLTSTKWLQTLHIAALWPPQSTMVYQTSSNNFCLFVKIGPTNILLGGSVWLAELFSRILRRWYGPTAMICDSYLKNQSAGCYWHHKWTREQAGDPKMENLLIESHSKSGFSQLYIWVDSCLAVISMSLNLVSADFHQTFGVCL